MVDIAQASEISTATAGMVGAVGGGTGVLWLAKLLLSRMIGQYDKRQDEQATELKAIAKEFSATLGDLKTKVAVVETLLGDSRSQRAELDGKYIALKTAVDDLREDVWVLARRLELTAKGAEISDILKIQRRR